MRRPRWINRKTLIATAALVSGGVLASPAVTRAVTTALIEHDLEDRFQVGVSCTVDPEEHSVWFEYNPDRLCRVNADIIILSYDPDTGSEFAASGYVGSEYGATVTVLSSGNNLSTQIHERAHRGQGTVNRETVADNVVFRTFQEADARLAVIIEAYRALLSSGDRKLWDEINVRHPEMLYVFDTLLREDAASRASLAEGGLPSVRIMRQTAMTYLFSRNAAYYLNNQYRFDYSNMREGLQEGKITFTPLALSQALPREGVTYLFTEGVQRQDSPLNRWVLYETLGVGLGRQERASESAFSSQEAELSRAIEAAGEEDVVTLTALHTDVCRRSPEALAYQAAGLARFRGQLTRASLSEPLRGITLLVDPRPQHADADTGAGPPTRTARPRASAGAQNPRPAAPIELPSAPC